MSDDAKNSQSPTESYEVGYCRPPRGAQFRPGVSGNPRGRPKGAKSLASVLEKALAEPVVVTENGKRKQITKLEAAVKQLTNRAASGDVRSQQLLLGLVQALEARPSQAPPERLDGADEAVLLELKRRIASVET